MLLQNNIGNVTSLFDIADFENTLSKVANGFKHTTSSSRIRGLGKLPIEISRARPRATRLNQTAEERKQARANERKLTRRWRAQKAIAWPGKAKRR